MNKKIIFILLSMALLFTGCIDGSAATTENKSENTVGEIAENSTEDSILKIFL